MDNSALILFGHGARDARWAEPLQRVLAEVKARQPKRPARIAFLEFMSPSLEECVAALRQEGCVRLRVVPMFMAQSGHLTRDLPAQIEVLRQRFPDLQILVSEAVGESPQVVAAMAGFALSQD